MVQTAGPPYPPANHLTNGDNTDSGDFVRQYPQTRRPERLAMEITVTALAAETHQGVPDFGRYLSLPQSRTGAHAGSQEHYR